MSQWIINPSLDMPEVLEQYGRFLANDYRMVIESMAVPDSFDEYSEKTGRKFIIVGSKERPGLLAKTVFLCIKLAGPESICVYVETLDDMFLIQNVFENYGQDVDRKIFSEQFDPLNIGKQWRDEIESATDIIVYSNNDKVIKAWRDLETVDRHVWEHGYNFSFGVVNAISLTPSIINEICFDFFCFYGEGRLAPRFYFVIGQYSDKIVEQFAMNMVVQYGALIHEYRSKLPFTRKSDFTRDSLTAPYKAKFIRVDNLNSESILDTLYGDVRLIFVDSYDEVEDFVEKWREHISTIAVNDWDDEDIFDIIDSNMIPRTCNYGDMQFPDFFEYYDAIDDFSIFVQEDMDDGLI